MEIIALVPTRFRLDYWLEQRQMSQRELARLSRVSPTTVNRMHANLTTRVDLATLDALAGVLKIEPGELIEREPRKPRRKGAA